jgi:hypothetical protein
VRFSPDLLLRPDLAAVKQVLDAGAARVAIRHDAHHDGARRRDGGPVVPQHARLLIGTRGFKGLFEALDRGEWLPAAAAMATVSGAVMALQAERSGT